MDAFADNCSAAEKQLLDSCGAKPDVLPRWS